MVDRDRNRVCRLCGASLDGMRVDATYCSPAHRVEGNRLKAILSGSSSAPYSSVAERLHAGHSRTWSFLGPSPSEELAP